MYRPAFAPALVAALITTMPAATLGAQAPKPFPVPGAPLQPLPERFESERFMSVLRSGGAALPPGVTIVDSPSSPRVRAMAGMLQRHAAGMNAANAAGQPPLFECPMRVARLDSARVPDMPVGRDVTLGDSTTRVVALPCVNPLDR